MRKLLLLAVLFIVGCAIPSNDGRLADPPETISKSQVNRFEIVSYQQFQDTSAYSDKRAVILIKDRQTGEEYVAITGAGVVQRGSHMAGKISVQDEK